MFNLYFPSAIDALGCLTAFKDIRLSGNVAKKWIQNINKRVKGRKQSADNLPCLRESINFLSLSILTITIPVQLAGSAALYT